MKLAIMQPYFMPYIGYFQCISAVDKYILYGNLTFIKDAWMNRNRILLKNGKIQTISVPLQHKSSNTLISEVRIDNTQPWQSKMLKTIFLNYKGAVYFEEIYSFIESIIDKDHSFLFDLNAESIISIASFLGIETEIDTDNGRFNEMEEHLNGSDTDFSIDFPYLITNPPRKVARVIEMCRREKSNDFVNAIGGRDLYSKVEFSKYGINLSFVKTDDIIYQQFGNPFEPNLSIIDVLMHNGKEGTRKLLQEYTLV